MFSKAKGTVQPRNESPQQSVQVSKLQKRVESEDFGSWKLVERRKRRKPRSKESHIGGMIGGSRFGVLDDDQSEKSREDLGVFTNFNEGRF